MPDESNEDGLDVCDVSDAWRDTACLAVVADDVGTDDGVVRRRGAARLDVVRRASAGTKPDSLPPVER